MSSTRNELRAAVLAVREGTPAKEIVFAGAEWARSRADGVSLLDVLVRRRALSGPVRRKVELELAKEDPSVLDVMTAAETPMDSLTHGETEQRTEPSHGGAPDDSLGNDENVGQEAPQRYEPRTAADGAPVLLGKGGLGKVTLVFDRFTGREVALKELAQAPRPVPVDTASDAASAEARFLREARVTGQLEHPGVVPVFEVGRRKAGALYYTMRRIKGRTLARAIADAASLGERLVLLPHFVAMCHAIAYAHSRRVIHRDIKPQNVMVGQFGETYVLDWGLARVKGRPDPRKVELRLAPDITGNSMGGAIGTPAYMSPEQARGQVDEIDERSDVWGLGAVLYELLTGRAPYLGRSSAEVVAQVRESPPDPVRSVEPGAPPELVAIVERAMARDKKDRYESAAALGRDIERYRAGLRVSAHAYSSWELLRRFGRQNRLALGVTAPALGALLLFAGWSWLEVRDEARESGELARFFVERVSPRLAPLPGAGALVEKLTLRTLAYYERTVDPHRGPWDDRLSMTQAFVNMGRLAYEVGRLEDALKMFQRARDAAGPLEAERPDDWRPPRLAAEALVGLGDVAVDSAREADADLHYAAAVEAARRAQRLGPKQGELFDTVSRSMSRLGYQLAETGRLSAARPLLEAAVESDEQWLATAPNNPEARRSLTLTLGYLGDLVADLGEFDRADQYFRRGLALAESTLSRNPRDDGAREARLSALSDLGELALRRGNEPEGRQLLAQAAQLGEELVLADPGDVDLRALTLFAELGLGDLERPRAHVEAVRQRGLSGNWSQLYVLIDLLAGRYALVLREVPRVAPQYRYHAYLQGAMAAALLGDAEQAAAWALEAEQLVPTSRNLWPMGVRERLLALEGKNRAPVAALVAELEAAYMRARPDETRGALSRFATALRSPASP